MSDYLEYFFGRRWEVADTPVTYQRFLLPISVLISFLPSLFLRIRVLIFKSLNSYNYD